MVEIADIRRAAGVIAGAVERTPAAWSRTLGRMLGCRIALKFENRQFTGSFKERGALNKLLSLSADDRRRGVIACSAGNHAQGVAYHASRLGIPVTVVMPRDTPFVKVENTRFLGAEVVLHGDGFAEAAAHMETIQAERGQVFVPPFDDPVIIAGQGTCGLEFMEDVPEIDTLLVPVGGGGLISGCAIAAKAAKPGIRVVGVQSACYAPYVSRRSGGPAQAAGGVTIAEGIAVKRPGAVTLPLVDAWVDDVVAVGEAPLERAINLLLTIEKTVVEGAGAAGLAAVIDDPDRFRGRTVGVVLSGGNIDARLLASVILRDLARNGHMTRLRIALSDTAGQLARAAGIIGEAGGNIVDVAHQRVFSHLPARVANLEVAVETRDRAQIDTIVGRLGAAGYDVDILPLD